MNKEKKINEFLGKDLKEILQQKQQQKSPLSNDDFNEVISDWAETNLGIKQKKFEELQQKLETEARNKRRNNKEKTTVIIETPTIEKTMIMPTAIITDKPTNYLISEEQLKDNFNRTLNEKFEEITGYKNQTHKLYK